MSTCDHKFIEHGDGYGTCNKCGCVHGLIGPTFKINQKMNFNFLRYINPVYWLSVAIDKVARIEQKRQLVAAINAAEKINKETGARVLVFNTTTGVKVVKKNELTGKQKIKMKGKAFYETGSSRKIIIEPRDNSGTGVPLV